MFTSILNTYGLSLWTALACTGTSLVFGLLVSLMVRARERCSKNFAISLALLPMLVQAVIMMVNGNLGTSVAVVGTFSLVRFRSLPGSSREILGIFFAMAVGLATGMGQLGFALCITLAVGLSLLLLSRSSFGEPRNSEKLLRITVPEDLDYTTAFDDLFATFTRQAQLTRVKTTSLGSLFELQYLVALKDPGQEKSFLDALRCRNGNLTIVCGQLQSPKEAL